MKLITRKEFNFLDVMSEIGGLLKIIILTMTILISPVSRYLYKLLMMQRMYFARTEKAEIFQGNKWTPDDKFLACKLKYLSLPVELQGKGFEDDFH